MSDEDRLKEKLRAIEALFAGAVTPGERNAAGAAWHRIMERMEALQADARIEWQFSSLDRWNRRLLLALAKRYGLKPYRRKRQHRSTVMVRAPERFLQDVFVPEFVRMADVLDEHLNELAERVIAEVLETEAPSPPQLELLEE